MVLISSISRRSGRWTSEGQGLSGLMGDEFSKHPGAEQTHTPVGRPIAAAHLLAEETLDTPFGALIGGVPDMVDAPDQPSFAEVDEVKV